MEFILTQMRTADIHLLFSAVLLVFLSGVYIGYSVAINYCRRNSIRDRLELYKDVQDYTNMYIEKGKDVEPEYEDFNRTLLHFDNG